MFRLSPGQPQVEEIGMVQRISRAGLSDSANTVTEPWWLSDSMKKREVWIFR